MAGTPSLCDLLDASFPRTRESRFGLRPISLDTRFRGYDGTQATSSLSETAALQVFSKEAVILRCRKRRIEDGFHHEGREEREVVIMTIRNLGKLRGAIDCGP